MIRAIIQNLKEWRSIFFNQPTIYWFAYEVVVGVIALLVLAGRESHAPMGDPMPVLRHFPVQELPVLAGALVFAQVPEYFTHRKWLVPVIILSILGCTSLDLGVLLRAASDQHGHLGTWQIWLGYASAILAFFVAALSAGVRGRKQEQEEASA